MKVMRRWYTVLSALLGVLGVGVVSAGAVACGDSAGPGGTDVPCACGDTVITTTILDAATDSVVSTGPGDACAGAGLLVGADGITLDLGQNTLRGTAFAGSGVSLVGRSDVIVQNGAVTGFDTGVMLSGSSDNLVTQLSITDNARGIVLDGSVGATAGNVLTRNAIADGAAGIELVAANGPPRNEVVGNVVSGSTRGILVTDGSDNLVEKNTVTGCFIGIQITAGGGNLVRNNQSMDNGDDGIFVASCDGGNAFLVNRVLRNLGHGLRAAACPAPTADAFERNIADWNTGDGLHVESDGNTVSGNRGKRNRDDGLDITGTGNHVKSNVFDLNLDWGICVDPGNFDDGGNRASRNVSGQISFAGACSH